MCVSVCLCVCVCVCVCGVLVKDLSCKVKSGEFEPHKAVTSLRSGKTSGDCVHREASDSSIRLELNLCANQPKL